MDSITALLSATAHTKPRRPASAIVSREAELLAEISTRLGQVVAVLAAQGKDREKQIDILSAAGCDSTLIGTVVGMNASSVRTLQSRRRAKAKTEPLPEPATE
jgi:hypothetical protein